MKFHLNSIVLAILVSLTFAEVPSYFKVCGRHDPNISKCVKDRMIELIPRLLQGLPELNIPSMDVIDIGQLTLINLNNFHAIGKNTKVRGLLDLEVLHFNVDSNKQQIDVQARHPMMYIDSNLEVDAKILVPIKDKGPIHIITKNLVGKVSMKYKIINRRGVQLLYFSSMTVQITVNDFEANFKSASNDTTITRAINSVIKDSGNEIIETMKPNLEETMASKLLDISNSICKHFTYDELFPDRI